MRVRHLSNTANNAFHNVQLLERYAMIESELPIQMIGLRHAVSAPAWEVVEFDVPSSDWVAEPDWANIPEALEVNSRYTDLEAGSSRDESGSSVAAPGIATALRTRLFGSLRGKRWSRPLIDARDRLALRARPILPELENGITLLYGSSSLFGAQVSRSAQRTVCLEHGTVRWIADGKREERAFRDAYRQQVQRSQHLWVTNLDPRTLEVAEDVAPGRWSVLPHPSMPDPRVPFAESPQRRQQLLAHTNSAHLILLPASQNWSSDHDKGSITALRAFVQLRRAGVDVGLVAVEWGHQLEESKAFLEQSGMTRHVTWVPLMPRLALQRTMANVDVVWDQFGLEVFGALALRALEQGTPLVSRGLAAEGERFIGGPVPWRAAGTSDEIVRETTAILKDMVARGRNAVIAETTDHYRGWLSYRHSPAVTASLQQVRYEQILEGHRESGGSAPDGWPTLVASGVQRDD